MAADPTGTGALLEGIAAVTTAALSVIAAYRTGRRGAGNVDAAEELREAVIELRKEERLEALEEGFDGNREINAQQAARIRQLEAALHKNRIEIPPRKGTE